MLLFEGRFMRKSGAKQNQSYGRDGLISRRSYNWTDTVLNYTLVDFLGCL